METTALHDTLFFTTKSTTAARTVAARRNTPLDVVVATLGAPDLEVENRDPSLVGRHSNAKVIAAVLGDPQWAAARDSNNMREVLCRARNGAATIKVPGFGWLYVTARDDDHLPVINAGDAARDRSMRPMALTNLDSCAHETVVVSDVLVTRGGVTVFAGEGWRGL